MVLPFYIHLIIDLCVSHAACVPLGRNLNIMKLVFAQLSFSLGGSRGWAQAPQHRFLGDTKEPIIRVCYYQSWWTLWYLKEQGSLCHVIHMVLLQRLNSSSLLTPCWKNNPVFLKLIWKENGSWISRRGWGMHGLSLVHLLPGLMFGSPSGPRAVLCCISLR